MSMKICQTWAHKVFAAVDRLICHNRVVIFILCNDLEDFSIFNINILFQCAFRFFIQNPCTLK